MTNENEIEVDGIKYVRFEDKKQDCDDCAFSGTDECWEELDSRCRPGWIWVRKDAAENEVEFDGVKYVAKEVPDTHECTGCAFHSVGVKIQCFLDRCVSVECDPCHRANKRRIIWVEKGGED